MAGPCYAYGWSLQELSAMANQGQCEASIGAPEMADTVDGEKEATRDFKSDPSHMEASVDGVAHLGLVSRWRASQVLSALRMAHRCLSCPTNVCFPSFFCISP